MLIDKLFDMVIRGLDLVLPVLGVQMDWVYDFLWSLPHFLGWCIPKFIGMAAGKPGPAGIL